MYIARIHSYITYLTSQGDRHGLFRLANRNCYHIKVCHATEMKLIDNTLQEELSFARCF